MTTTQDNTRRDGVRSIDCSEFEQDGYLILSPSSHPRGTPLIIAFRHTHGAADTHAANEELNYGKEVYPCGLLVVPCKVLFDIPNTEITGREAASPERKTNQ